MTRLIPALAAFNAMLALTVGTFAAHGIPPGQARDWIMTGVLFQLPHVAAVFALLGWRSDRATHYGALGLALGSLIFAADLYALALGAPRWIAALAPIGGTTMMFAWFWIAILALAGDRFRLP
ncbi:DUF423 domain-containing protein [Sandaracinobacteroides saxicola]|uniref:DUF423 domain-containing protein n=1 Tax=Sandaracinobacteroides saxicola TaxID=2759707 RepID=A0A7G5IIH5_9SPHN|nr:DUF423 domain-containing protein [Sandaracinobacteroides saxicola]QMW23167.1 DUF423 domain-containing protein [Sandaracinobacteroides saxicola]